MILPGPLFLTHSDGKTVMSPVLTPGCRCGWEGTPTEVREAAESELKQHGVDAHKMGEFPFQWVA